MEAERLINGFTDKEVFELNAFLEAYERLYDEQDYQKNETLFTKHPELADLDKSFSSINYSGKDNSSQIVNETLSEDIQQIYGIRHGSPLLSFLYHPRNSIAHANIRKDGTRLYLEDKTKSRPRKLTAKGYIQSIEIVKTITNILNKRK